MDIRELIGKLAAQEVGRGGQFLAPSVRGGRVRVSLDGLVQTFRVRPRAFEGWGIFEAVDEAKARFIAEPGLAAVANYLKLLRPMRVRLAAHLRGQTWLARAANEDEAWRQYGAGGELQVHLVHEGARFDPVVAYTDGCNWFYGETDRRADARAAERLRKLFRQRVDPRYIPGAGITPEMRAAYETATEFAPEFRRVRQHGEAARAAQAQERRLRDALALGGGELVEYRDEGENWRVAWQTRRGQSHISTVAKRDLTVVSAGICLSGQDSDFDLQSLVGVVEDAWD